MAVFKCKMCGGALEINYNKTVAECGFKFTNKNEQQIIVVG